MLEISPTTQIFGIILFGLLIGKIRIKNVSLGIAGVMMSSMLFGALFSAFHTIHIGCLTISFSSSESEMSVLSMLGTAVFSSSIGIDSGFKMKKSSKKDPLWGLFSSGIVFVNYLFLRLICNCCCANDSAYMLGIFCGAMTSTPGLSSVCERSGTGSSSAIAGYSTAYIIGVMTTVLFVQIFADKKAAHPQIHYDKHNNQSFSVNDMLRMSLAIIIGCLVGAFHFPCFSLGVTGGILFAAILIGILTSKTGSTISRPFLGIMRNVGLILFFVGNGYSAGEKAMNDFSISSLLFGLILTLLPIMISYLFSRILLRKCKDDSLYFVCGVMTSSPGIGVLTDRNASSDNSTLFSTSYLGSLITIIFCMRI